MDEFVLRALKVGEGVSLKRLGSFFGFTTAEAEVVIGDMASRGLIDVKGDIISLHQSALEMFRHEDGLPRLVEIDPWVERVWFDLVSRNFITPDESRPSRNLLELRSDTLARDLPASFARRAFEENFAEYLRTVRRVRDVDRFALYSVSDVEAERFGSIVITGGEDLVFDPEPRLQATFLTHGAENAAKYRMLSIALADAYRPLRGPDVTLAGLSDFSRMLGDKSVAAATNDAGLFDLPGWQSANAAVASSLRQVLVGASYIERNLSLLVEQLDKRFLIADDTKSPKQLEIRWYRPGGSSWGATPDLNHALATLKSVLRRRYPKTPVKTTLIAPNTTSRESLQRFRRIFDDCIIAPAGTLSPSVEVLQVGQVAAASFVRVALSNTVSISVGFAISHPADVQTLDHFMGWSAIFKRGEVSWSDQPVSENGDLAPDGVVGPE